jgi:hypothetical protein
MKKIEDEVTQKEGMNFFPMTIREGKKENLKKRKK